MTKPSFGTLKSVKLEIAWEHEAHDFTPWLASEENLNILGQTIGVDLELEAQEKNVGPFKADLLCKDTMNDHWVLIENQLYSTDHTHLGQLLTYAAGLEAATIVWIAREFREEHRAALDWLNRITTDDFNFFGLQIELWQIGESPYAPRFNTICKPNDWSRNVTAAAKHIDETSLSETRKTQLSFWTAFRDFLAQHDTRIRATKPFPQSWMTFAAGRAGFQFLATIVITRQQIHCGLVMNNEDAEAYYSLLKEQQVGIQQLIGEHPLIWKQTRGTKQRTIYLECKADPSDETDWPRQHEWILRTLERFRAVFWQRIRTLNAEDYEADA
jgi:hypothetical protein